MHMLHLVLMPLSLSCRDGLPSSNDANLMLLQRQTRLLSSPHAWLLDFLTPDVTVASRMVSPVHLAD